MGHESRTLCDVLIIGSGIAGASAALEAARHGLDVIVITKEDEKIESASRYAQGGIAGLGDDDSVGCLAQDILRAGDRLSYPAAVEVVAREGPELIRRILIDELDVPFDREPGGRVDLTLEGAHSKRRVFHHKDSTGEAIQRGLIGALDQRRKVRFLPGHQAIDLITFPHHSLNPVRVYEDRYCCGAYVLDLESRTVKAFFARAVILATGGVGRLYLHTTNPPCATGDGLAMAYRAGAEVINMEFVQFHPTGLFTRDEERFLISEALRGEGARLKNRRGELFVRKYAPDMGDLAPRDVVTRAIWEEMARCGDNYVLLDLASYVREGVDIRERFPTIYRRCLEHGIDITSAPIPVVPVAHYFCGGIKVDLDGRTNLKGLYAVGETACTGVHGANRLASISLLEGLVWGTRASRAISEELPANGPPPFDEIPDWLFPVSGEDIDPVLILQDWLSIRTTMWNYAGIIRSNKRLSRAIADISYLERRILEFYKQSTLSRGLIELRNGIIVARLMIEAALRNRESMGCHFRSD
jgi:L-aspartate oxidase